MKKILIFVAIVVLIFVGIASYINQSKEEWIRKQLVDGFKSLLGTEIEMDGFRVEFVPGTSAKKVKVAIDEFRVVNPSQFKPKYMVIAREVSSELDFFEFLSKRYKIEYAKVALSEINLDKNDQGVLNIKTIPMLDPAKLGTSHASGFWMKRMDYILGTLTYTAPGQEEAKVVNFNAASDVYSAVDDPGVLIQGPALKMVYAIGEGSMGLPLGKIQEHLAQHTSRPEPKYL